MLHLCAKPPVHPRRPRSLRGRCRVPSGAEIGSWHRERLAFQNPQRHTRARARTVPSTKPGDSAHPQPLFLPPPGTTGYRAQVTSSCGVTSRQMPLTPKITCLPAGSCALGALATGAREGPRPLSPRCPEKGAGAGASHLSPRQRAARHGFAAAALGLRELPEQTGRSASRAHVSKEPQPGIQLLTRTRWAMGKVKWNFFCV